MMTVGTEAGTETAIFAAGCFWGVEYRFSQVAGVLSAESGYIGGTTSNPTYQEVCTGTSDHAEAVRLIYDRSLVTFEMLLDVFWELHDPTQLNRQGADHGRQYRSAIFCMSEDQLRSAETSRTVKQESPAYANRKIVTEILMAPEFWRAEEAHQNYVQKRQKAI